MFIEMEVVGAIKLAAVITDKGVKTFNFLLIWIPDLSALASLILRIGQKTSLI